MEASRFYFPINCSLSPITIATNYGNPYPNDRTIRRNPYFEFVVEMFNLLRYVENNYSTFRSIVPNLPPNFNSVENRLLFIEKIVEYVRSGGNQNPAVMVGLKISTLKGGRAFLSKSFHPGVDINYGTGNQDFGLPVYSVGPGTVIASSPRFCNDGSCSGYVAIQHLCKNEIFYALYGHINPEVRTGAKVNGGQRIGTIGSYTGGTSHLHFEISKKNIYQNLRLTYPSYTNFNGVQTTLQINLTYLTAVIYDTLKVNLNPNSVCVPFKYYVELFDDPQNPSWKVFTRKLINIQNFSDEVFYGGEYAKKYGFVDPINFLLKISSGKLYSPVTNSVCPSSVTVKQNQQPSQICLSVVY